MGVLTECNRLAIQMFRIEPLTNLESIILPRPRSKWEGTVSQPTRLQASLADPTTTSTTAQATRRWSSLGVLGQLKWERISMIKFTLSPRGNTKSNITRSNSELCRCPLLTWPSCWSPSRRSITSCWTKVRSRAKLFHRLVLLASLSGVHDRIFTRCVCRQ